MNIAYELSEYNKIVAKFQMALIYLDNKTIESIDKEKHFPKFRSIVSEMESYLKSFRENKIKYTDTEAYEGFNVEFRVTRFEKYGY